MEETLITNSDAVILLVQSVLLGVLIMPVVQLLKKIAFFTDVEPRYMVASLSIISVWLASIILAPDMTILQIINGGLAAAGTATLTHAAVRPKSKK